MARVFVSGSSTGLGLLAGKELLAKGHDVIFHARTAARAEDIRREVAVASSVVVADISTVRGAMDLADQVGALGPSVPSSTMPAWVTVVRLGQRLTGSRTSLPSKSWRPTSLRPGSAVGNGWSISAPACTGCRRT
jgi:NAD(P)-dependent dehydrogenase (short-subunit alcohol dehydrogenase family)